MKKKVTKLFAIVSSVALLTTSTMAGSVFATEFSDGTDFISETIDFEVVEFEASETELFTDKAVEEIGLKVSFRDNYKPEQGCLIFSTDGEGWTRVEENERIDLDFSATNTYVKLEASRGYEIDWTGIGYRFDNGKEGLAKELEAQLMSEKGYLIPSDVKFAAFENIEYRYVGENEGPSDSGHPEENKTGMEIRFRDNYKPEQGSLCYSTDGKNWKELKENWRSEADFSVAGIKIRLKPNKGYEVDWAGIEYAINDQGSQMAREIKQELTSASGYTVPKDAKYIIFNNIEFRYTGENEGPSDSEQEESRLEISFRKGYSSKQGSVQYSINGNKWKSITKNTKLDTSLEKMKIKIVPKKGYTIAWTGIEYDLNHRERGKAVNLRGIGTTGYEIPLAMNYFSLGNVEFAKVSDGIETAKSPVAKATLQNGSIKLTWSDVPFANTYTIYLKDSNKWKSLGNTSKTNYTYKPKNGLVSGKNYTFFVRITKGNLTSNFDGKGTTIKYLSCPQIPTVKKSGKDIKLSWKKVTGAASYDILRKEGNGKWIKIANTKNTSYKDKYNDSSKLIKNKKYSYSIRAVNGKTISSYNTTGKSITYK